MRFKREHKYETKMYEEQLYKEVVFDTRTNATEVEEYRSMNPLMKARGGGGRLRNLQEHAKKISELARAPYHQRKKTPVTHMHPELNSKKMKAYDPYGYFHRNLSKEEEDVFMQKEQEFFELMLLKNDLLTKHIWREQEYYSYDH